ncbi:16236_t:CDS:2 [Funneliformis caledonium]|uniref:16236_t:CDS:1 n=1 Tax=Funneliformis caledonium TaxID=1117310 RepID=A0A9N9CK39_9GLOM|nr:16236_t:CDS:2 [Funneliformis caledonium]
MMMQSIESRAQNLNSFILRKLDIEDCEKVSINEIITLQNKNSTLDIVGWYSDTNRTFVSDENGLIYKNQSKKCLKAQNDCLTQKQQKIISGLSETIKHLGYDIREVRDRVTRSSNAGSDTSKTPQKYTGTIFELWEEIDALFNEKKHVKSGL